jgi:hypothetical protein
MIYTSDLSAHRLGNALFKIAFAKSLVYRHNVFCCFPKWKYTDYLTLAMPESNRSCERKLKEENFDYHPVTIDPLKDYDCVGYWQSFKYFADVWAYMKGEFMWNEEFLNSILERTDLRPGPLDWSVHLRLTDYCSNPNYVQIPPSYYTEFFIANRDSEYFVFSDDIPMAKRMLGSFPNVQYVMGSEDIEDMALMSQFENHIISNSTYSWWSAHLATLYHEKVNVVRPDGLFSGELAKTCKGNDFYKPEWQVKNIYGIKLVKNDKIDLKDCTFVAVVKIDSSDRRENLQLMLEFLLKHYDTNIIIGENGTNECEWVATLPNVRYVHFDDFVFHRTKFLNELFRMSETEIVVNHDVDVLIPPPQMEEAVRLIRTGFDFVFPYGGDFLRIPRCYYGEIKASLDTACLEGKEQQGVGDNSVGGCVIAKKTSHFKAGGENEKYMKFGREDVSRANRYKLFGNCTRIPGPLYHIEHFIGPDSSPNHDFRAINLSECRKELSMTKDKLKDYINTWGWAK